MSIETLENMEVKIAGRSYPLKVKPEERPMLSEIVDRINEKVNSFQKSYGNKDAQDCISMTLLTYAFELEKKTTEVNNKAVLTKIKKIDNLLDRLIKPMSRS